jgi:hypothetical protein
VAYLTANNAAVQPRRFSSGIPADLWMDEPYHNHSIPFHYSEYFDVDPSKEKGQTQAQAKPQAVGQQMNVDNRQPSRDP